MKARQEREDRTVAQDDRIPNWIVKLIKEFTNQLKQGQTQSTQQPPQAASATSTKKPASISVMYDGKEGSYRFYIQVLDGNEDGIETNIKIKEGKLIYQERRTDNVGAVMDYRADIFYEKDRTFVFEVDYPGLTERVFFEITLPGPPQLEIQKPEPVRPVTFAEVKKIVKEKNTNESEWGFLCRLAKTTAKLVEERERVV